MKLIELFDFSIRVLFVTKLPPVEVVLGLFLPKHELYDRERNIKFGGHLRGFGADMFEAEINKSNTVLTFKESYD